MTLVREGGRVRRCCRHVAAMQALNYTTTAVLQGSNPAEHAHGVLPFGRRAQLLERERQVLGERLDRRIFAVDEATWNRVQELLDGPPTPKPALTRLLAEPSVLESPAG